MQDMEWTPVVEGRREAIKGTVHVYGAPAHHAVKLECSDGQTLYGVSGRDGRAEMTLAAPQ